MFSKTRIAGFITVFFLLVMSVSSFAQPIYLPTTIDEYYEAADQTRDYIILPGCTITGEDGYLFVDEGVTLLASTLFTPAGSITVTNGGRLFIDGESDNRVTVTSDDGTSTWGGIHYTTTAATSGSAIKYCDISLATTGIHMETYIFNTGMSSFIADSVNYCQTGVLVENGNGMDIQGFAITNCTYGVRAEDVPLPSGCVSVYQCDLLNNTNPVRFEDCGYVGFSGKIVGGGTGVYARYCEALSIDHDYQLPHVIKSKIEGVTSYGVYASHVQSIDIDMLEVDGGDITNYGIYIYNYGEVNDTTSITRTLTYDMDYTGTRIYRCDNVYIDHLDSYDNHRYGLQLSNVNDLTGVFTSNLHRNDYHGLYMYNVQYQDYYDGYLYDSYLGYNGQQGILIEDSDLIVVESTIEENGQYGIFVYDGVDLDIGGSLITENDDEGIRVNTSSTASQAVDIEIDTSNIIANDAGASSDQIYSWLQGLAINYGNNYIYSSTTTWEISGPQPLLESTYYCRGNYWGEIPGSGSDIVNPLCSSNVIYTLCLAGDPGNGPFPTDPWADNISSGNENSRHDLTFNNEVNIDYNALRAEIVNIENDLALRLRALNTYSHQSINHIQDIKNILNTDDDLYLSVNNKLASAYILSSDYSHALELYAENKGINDKNAFNLNILNTYYRWAENNVLNNEGDVENFEKDINSELAELPVIPGTEEFKPANLNEYHNLLNILESTTDAELAVGDEESSRIESYELEAPYPNPFNPNVTIPFSLPESSDIKVEVYNLLGEKVASLVNGTMEAGKHQVVWNGIDNSGQQVASGIYYVKMQAADFNQTSRIVFMK